MNSVRSFPHRLIPIGLATALFMLGLPVLRAADGPQLDAATLKRVKAATVHFKVTLSDGRIAQGSGFFTDEPGLIVTNAHVLNMLAPDSRKPAKVEVTIEPGTDASRTLVSTVLGVDRGSDLALVRVEGKAFPAPLKLGATTLRARPCDGRAARFQ